jgi:hypothetical protein
MGEGLPPAGLREYYHLSGTVPVGSGKRIIFSSDTGVSMGYPVLKKHWLN